MTEVAYLHQFLSEGPSSALDLVEEVASCHEFRSEHGDVGFRGEWILLALEALNGGYSDVFLTGSCYLLDLVGDCFGLFLTGDVLDLLLADGFLAVILVEGLFGPLVPDVLLGKGLEYAGPYPGRDKVRSSDVQAWVAHDDQGLRDRSEGIFPFSHFSIPVTMQE